ncbi:hypothetical protein [Methylophilus sp. 5]|uniref:hypothetical protein n=1 Tax=Methylophilus sp. 5 TaxID=1112274 RepID=UPI00048ED869|nr:hypothetical protein [Methylophilus sp. 5]
MRTKQSNIVAYTHSLLQACTLAIFWLFTPSVLLHAAPTPTYTPQKPLTFADGSAQMRKGLSQYPALAEIVEGRFSIANADFNDDGRAEIVLMGADSNFCGSGGCQTYVVEFLPNKAIKVLVTAYFGGDIAMTNEKVDGYRALASVHQGRIEIANKRGTPMHAALHGKQIVYPMRVTEIQQTAKHPQ